jgi:tRNA A37 N6-isopentenylltransferase MiaA
VSAAASSPPTLQASAPLLVVITGPTGSGKSDLALALCEQLQAELPVEIVSVD